MDSTKPTADPYEDFLQQRRGLLAQVIREGFANIDAKALAESEFNAYSDADEPEEQTLAELLDAGILLPGDLLDSAEQDTQIDAVVTEDRTILIDGEHEFDSLDDAARHVGVTNISGFEFWVLERDGGYASLDELIRKGRE